MNNKSRIFITLGICVTIAIGIVAVILHLPMIWQAILMMHGK